MESRKIVSALSALAQETRLGIFQLLVRAGPAGLSAGVIARELGVVASTLSHHLGLLEQAELVRSARSGRHVIYSCDLEGVRTLVRFLSEDIVTPEATLGCAAE
ncbi:ArsR/SmtB family transcription factor [Thalassobaculum sp.]|jgi:DNA-binding transcriptional ArsR family regulator|uniref:ArsR/SmtB family transcription factor n=1 Tax=Thalassobaculum sp. TaxID=2022740 RepID=UPI003B5CA465